mmetsp:Transcript_49869/g.93306  ORF Transcript_49869/g.93306 Transcript_49869/m.93306 type:complete len:252 (+) Transcript_49869:74-829(+)
MLLHKRHSALHFCLLLLAKSWLCAAQAMSCDAADPSAKAAGDSLRLCVFISSKPTQRMAFQIKVDESAELALQGSDNFAFQDTDVYTWVSGSHAGPAHPLDCSNDTEVTLRGSEVSCPQIYSSAVNVAQLANLVVNMRDGLVSSFVWDNGCSGCAPARCMDSSRSFAVDNLTTGDSFFQEGTCGQARDACVGKANLCDLKIFVTWAGTDKRGRNLLSAGSRLSKLTGPTLRSLYETLQEGYTAASQAVSSR